MTGQRFRALTAAFTAALTGFFLVGAAYANPNKAELESLAAGMARRLATSCPPASRSDADAHGNCAVALRDASFLPIAPAGLLFGGDQPDLRFAKKQLTHLNKEIFQSLYLSLFTFTGRWTVEVEDGDQAGVIRVEAYFRNALPPGKFPYPFWHSAEKWDSYETANELRFYVNNDGRIFAVTRSKGGSEANRGPWAHVTPPAFDGQWQWVDQDGQAQPRVSLFSSRYRPENPFLASLESAYRAFATDARNGTCLNCHSPNNEAGMSHLLLLQTPMHASGEIDAALKAVRNGEMPQDDLGLRKNLPPGLREEILRSGEAFRDALRAADQWETAPGH